MDEIKCQYAVHQSEFLVTCKLLCDYTGFSCGLGKTICQRCLDGGWSNGQVERSPEMLQLALNALKGRIMGGDCPRYQGPNPMDLRAAFNKLAAAVDRTEMRAVFLEALDAWSGVPVEDGGHDARTIAGEAERVAADQGFEKELEEWTAKRSSRR